MAPSNSSLKNCDLILNTLPFSPEKFRGVILLIKDPNLFLKGDSVIGLFFTIKIIIRADYLYYIWESPAGGSLWIFQGRVKGEYEWFLFELFKKSFLNTSKRNKGPGSDPLNLIKIFQEEWEKNPNLFLKGISNL